MRVQLLFFVLTLFPCLGMAQVSDSLDTNRMVEGAEVFRAKVDKIVLVRVDPICVTRRRDVENRPWKKKITSCYAESVLQCVYIGEELSCETDLSRLSGHTEVSSNDVDSILQILFESEEVTYLAACYMPRHGIIMYDGAGNQIGFVELCFECGRSMSSAEVPDFGFLPASAFNKLQEVFDTYGL